MKATSSAGVGQTPPSVAGGSERVAREVPGAEQAERATPDADKAIAGHLLPAFEV